MDKATFFKKVQEYTSNVPIIVLGSGSSAAFGLPTMGALSNELNKKLVGYSNIEDKKCVSLFNKAILTKDLENTLLDMQLTPNVQEDVIRIVWETINYKDLEILHKLQEKSIPFPLADLFSYLIQTTKKKLTVVTTNYDRLAEYAGGIIDAYCNTGFTNNYISSFIGQLSEQKYVRLDEYKGLVNIWKVHGSLDWFEDEVSSGVRCYPCSSLIPSHTLPCIVTPGLSKYRKTHLDPFRTILSNIDNEFKQAQSFLCIGYGFNDEHVHPLLIKKAQNDKTPITLITKAITASSKSAIMKCPKYILIEECNNGSKIYTPDTPDGYVFENELYWTIEGLINILK